MAVAFVARATSFKLAGSGLNLIVAVPVGTANGDAMVAFVSVRTGSAVPATPAGWNLIDDDTNGPSSASYWRVASSEPASYTWVVTNAVDSIGYIATYSGADGASPINTSSVWNRLASTTNVTGTTITPSVNDCMIVWMGASSNASTLSVPGGYNDRGIVTVLGGGPMVGNLADLLQGSAAATGNLTGTAGTSANTQGELLAIQPPTSAVANPYPYVGGGYYPTQG